MQCMWVGVKVRSYKYLNIYNDVNPIKQVIKIIYKITVKRYIYTYRHFSQYDRNGRYHCRNLLTWK